MILSAKMNLAIPDRGVNLDSSFGVRDTGLFSEDYLHDDENCVLEPDLMELQSSFDAGLPWSAMPPESPLTLP